MTPEENVGLTMKRNLSLFLLSAVLSLALTACGGGGGGGGDSGNGSEGGEIAADGGDDGGGAVVMLGQDLAGAARAQPNPTMGALEAN